MADLIPLDSNWLREHPLPTPNPHADKNARGRVFVVGDTVLDIACARAAGARSVAVATGPSDVETLRVAGADVVFEDLSDTAGFLALF